MSGAQDPGRRREPVRQVAVCWRCKLRKLGVTTFESMACGSHPIGRAIHFCDGCEAGIVERSLEEVVGDVTGVSLASGGTERRGLPAATGQL